MSVPNLLSTKEAAKLLGISDVTVIRLFDDGALAGVVIAQRGRRRILRFKPESIEKFIASRERKSK